MTLDFEPYIRAWQERARLDELRRRQAVQQALEEARRIADMLVCDFGAGEVWLFGSSARAVQGASSFHDHSDIDLAVDRLPDEGYFVAVADFTGEGLPRGEDWHGPNWTASGCVASFTTCPQWRLHCARTARVLKSSCAGSCRASTRQMPEEGRRSWNKASRAVPKREGCADGSAPGRFVVQSGRAAGPRRTARLPTRRQARDGGLSIVSSRV